MTSIATLGSHCALQVLKGAKDEGLKTLIVCEKRREKLYKRFNFIDASGATYSTPLNFLDHIL